MVDISRFVRRRKELGYSQVVLSEGICTQSTLSKFEREGQVPSLAILTRLCDRLGLSLDDLTAQNPGSAGYLRRVLNQVEESLMIEDFPGALTGLAKVNLTKLTTARARMRYCYLEGMSNALTNQKGREDLFSFTQILDELDERHQTIYTYLAYLGLGIYYTRHDTMDRATFFFKKVADYLERTTVAAANDPDRATDYLRLLAIVYYLAEYRVLVKQIPAARELIQQGLGICGQHHVTYFLPRLKLLQARVAIEEAPDSSQINTYLNDALAFARLNNNRVVQVQVAAIRKNYHELFEKVDCKIK